MQINKSNFIVLEGLDGSGKSTQVRLLRKLYSISALCYYIHFPGDEQSSPVFGKMISRFLRGDYGLRQNVHPELVALLYAGDRYNVAKKLNRKLKKGYTIIADRYVFSNIAYQCAKLKNNGAKEKLMEHILDMEYNYFKIPEPDLSLFLHVPISFIQQKLSNQRNGKDRNYLLGQTDIHEQSIDFQKEVEQMYLHICRIMPEKLHYISCMDNNGNILSTENIHKKIAQTLCEKNLYYPQ